MSCKTWRKLISLSLDEQLEGQALLQLNAHLQSCPECAQYMQSLQQQQASYKQLPQYQLPSYFNQSVWARIDQPLTNRFSPRQKWGVAFAGVAMAAITLMVVSRTIIFQSKPIPTIQQAKLIETPIRVAKKSKSIITPKSDFVEQKVITTVPTEEAIRVVKQPLAATMIPSASQGYEQASAISSNKATQPKMTQPSLPQSMKKKFRFSKRLPGKKISRQQHPARDNVKVESSSATMINATAAGGNDGAISEPTVVDVINTPEPQGLTAIVKIMNNKIRISQQDRMGIQIDLGHPANLVIKIYNRKGKMIKIIHEGILDSGRHTLEWDGTTDNGEAVASGIYVMMVGGEIKPQKHKIAVIK